MAGGTGTPQQSYFVAALFWPPDMAIGGLDRGKAGCESQDCAVVAERFMQDGLGGLWRLPPGARA